MPCQLNDIQFDDSTLQPLFARIETVISLSALVLAGWQFARRFTVLLIEETLDKRARRPTDWTNCPICDKKLQIKEFAKRQITTFIGVIRFSRRVGRCPNRCRIGQIAPPDTELQLTPRQRSCSQFKRVACLLAVFVPFETAQTLLNQLMGIEVYKDTIWQWVADAGQNAMDRLNDQLDSLTRGVPVAVESIDASIEPLPLLIGADGVMVPSVEKKGHPKELPSGVRSKWRLWRVSDRVAQNVATTASQQRLS